MALTGPRNRLLSVQEGLDKVAVSPNSVEAKAGPVAHEATHGCPVIEISPNSVEMAPVRFG